MRFRPKPIFLKNPDGTAALNPYWINPKLKVLGDAVFLPLATTKKYRYRRYTLIDQEDYERIERASEWIFAPSGLCKYARASSNRYLPNHHMRLHAFVLKAKHGEIVDHISGDGLDNRKQNLRICTPAENARNARRQTFYGKTSRFKGVSWSKYDGCWVACITLNGAQIYLGRYDEEDEAARSYDKAALEKFGEFARTNETMKLFEMPDPFVPDCSKAEEFDGTIQHTDVSDELIQRPRHFRRSQMAKAAFYIMRKAS